MLSVRRLTRAYGAHVVLRDLDLRISTGMRLGVIGPNGSGKTTLLRLLAGEDEPDTGAVGRAGQVQIGYARQDVTTVRGQRVLETVIEGAADVVDAQRRLRLLEQQLSATAAGPELDALLVRYGTLHDRFVNAAGYSLEAQARKVLAGLGFADAQMSSDVATLSGGWMMRVVLARLLLTTPDVLLLDEPTNHLDLDSAEWLTEYLTGYDGAVVAVSHDRWFLDRVATHVLALDGSGGHVLVRGNYSQYVTERETRLASQRATAAAQAREIAQTEAFVERFRAKASKARQVQSRIKALDRLERVEAPTELRSNLRLSLPSPPRSGRNVVRLDGAVKRFGRTEVFAGASLVIERGAKIAVIGPNGAGKSTLLRLIAGLEVPTAGTVELGYNVTPAYFAQHQLDMLDTDRTVLAELDAALRDRTTNPRSLLGAFGFSGDTVNKRVGQCSGGERARLALAKLVVGPANLLCLDEPTNHLDIDSRELLTAALDAYAGTVLLVTHDRALIRTTAATICAVGDGDLTLHDGDLDSYLSVQPPAADSANAAPPRDERKQRRQQAAADRARTSELRGQIADAERELDAAEQHLTDLERSLADPATYEDPERVRELSLAHAVASRRAAAASDHWERLVADFDAAGDPAAH